MFLTSIDILKGISLLCVQGIQWNCDNSNGLSAFVENGGSLVYHVIINVGIYRYTGDDIVDFCPCDLCSLIYVAQGSGLNLCMWHT